MRTRKTIPTLSRHVLLMLVAGILAWTGCDSNDDGGNEGGDDAELLVGVWNATSIKARLIDILSTSSKTVDALMKLELPSGVDVEIKV